MRRKIILLILIIFSTSLCFIEAQNSLSSDIIKLTLQDAEKQFLSKNLSLIAQKYNVDATQALIIQAKLYPNPTFSYTNTIYNTSNNNKYFDQSSKSDPAPQLTQLIILARKIHKQAKIAETNYKLSEDNFFDLLRNLKLALRNSFYNIYYLQQTAKVYDEEINALKVIVNAYNEVKGKGYVSEADVVSVQAQLYSLQNEYQTLTDNINDLESQLRIMLLSAPKTYIKPLVDTTIVKADPLAYNLSTLMDSAYKNRTDLMIANDNLVLSQQNLTLQKSLAVPDITFGPGFVNQSNFIKEDWVYVLSFSIPVFNRNQGNIKSAKFLINYNKSELDITKKTLEEEVSRGLQKAMDADKLYKGIDPSFACKFDTLANEMMKNYIKRNVSLLNFLTFYDSYKQNIVQLNSILFNKVNALENLNYLTGTNFFNK